MTIDDSDLKEQKSAADAVARNEGFVEGDDERHRARYYGMVTLSAALLLLGWMWAVKSFTAVESTWLTSALTVAGIFAGGAIAAILSGMDEGVGGHICLWLNGASALLFLSFGS